MLFETFVTEENTKDIESYFNNFMLHWEPAIKTAKYGRAIGGSLFGFRYSLSKNITYNRVVTRMLIHVKFNELDFYVIPTYLNYNDWDDKFQKLQLLLSENMIIGDCNARISEAQTLPEEIFYNINTCIDRERKSKNKVINLRGRKFLELRDENNQIILITVMKCI